MLASEQSDIVIDGAFEYLNKFRGDGVKSYLPEVEEKKAKDNGKEPMEMTQLRVGLYEIGKRRKVKEVKKKAYEVPEHLRKKKEEVDVLGDYAKYVNFVNVDDEIKDNRKGGDDSKKNSGWRDLSLDERKEKLDEYFQITLSNVMVDEKLKKKIYELVSNGKMTTAKDVKFDKVNQRIVALPLVMKFDEDKGCFVEPTIDKALKRKKAAIKRAKAFFN